MKLSDIFPPPPPEQDPFIFPNSVGREIDPGTGFSGQVLDPEMFVEREAPTRGPLSIPGSTIHRFPNAPERRKVDPRISPDQPVRSVPDVQREEPPEPTEEEQPTPEEPFNIPSLPGFKPLLTETLPDGNVRVLPNIVDHLEEDQRDVVNDYVTAFGGMLRAEEIGAARPRYTSQETRSRSEPSQYYEYFGEMVIGSEGEIQVRNPETGVIEALPARGVAIQPSTGKVFYARPRSEHLERGILIPAARDVRTGEVSPALTEGLNLAREAIENAAERIQSGLVVPEQQLVREALTVAGVMSSGTFGLGALKRGAERSVERVLGVGGTPSRIPTFEESLPPAEREIFQRLSPEIQQALRQSDNPMRPGEIEWMITDAGLPESAIVRNLGYKDRPTRLGTAGSGSRPATPRAPPPLEKEIDPAGFHIHSLETAKRQLPERGTADEMRAALLREGVDEGEIRSLGLDDLFYGRHAGTIRAFRDMERAQGRLGNELGVALRQERQFPLSQANKAKVEAAKQSLMEGAQKLGVARRESIIAMRESILDANKAVVVAEGALKKINRRIRGLEPSDVSKELLYQARAAAKRKLEAAKEARVHAAQNAPGRREISADEVVRHIRENRPILGTYVREYPGGRRYGDATEIVNTIRHSDLLPNHLRSLGISPDFVTTVMKHLRNTNPTEWGVKLSAMDNYMGRPGLLIKAIEEMSGMPLGRLAQISRLEGDISFIPPRYRFATPDKENPTLREIAITLTRKGENRPMFESPHWQGVSNPVSHMQTSIQRLPVQMSDDLVKKAMDMQERIDLISRERNEIGRRIDSSSISDAEFGRLHNRDVALEKELNKLYRDFPKVKPSENLVYIGHQFQSDWAAAVRGAMRAGGPETQQPSHHLVESARSWLRPTLEMFVDHALAARPSVRYIAIPDGATVMHYNPMDKGTTARFYDDVVRSELDHVLARRGIEPPSRREVRSIYSNETDEGWPGRWFVIEMPSGRVPREARLYSNPDDLGLSVGRTSLAGISRDQQTYPRELMRRRATEGRSLVHRVRQTQPTETELRNWPRAERIEMLEATDPHPGPVLGFHGTTPEFDIFDLSRSRDIGHHFGTRQQAGNILKNKTQNYTQDVGDRSVRIIPAYVNVRNPLELPDLGDWQPMDVAIHIRTRIMGNPRNYDIADRLVDRLETMTDREDMTREIRGALDDMGYDSIRYRNNVEGTGWSYIVWKRGLIRSATDPSHVLYSRGAPLPVSGGLGDDRGQE